jgi:hypothetical protein
VAAAADPPGGGPAVLVVKVGAAGFEPATPCSQSRCATGLRHAPKILPNVLTQTAERAPRASQPRAPRPATEKTRRSALHLLKWRQARRVTTPRGAMARKRKHTGPHIFWRNSVRPDLRRTLAASWSSALVAPGFSGAREPGRGASRLGVKRPTAKLNHSLQSAPCTSKATARFPRATR